MSMIVANNLPAINANKNLYTSNRALNKSIEKLSSGFRINVGADGPADLVISEQLRSQANGLQRAVRNTTEAINVLTIAEGALNEMNSILKKMKALAIHAANNGITSPDQVAADQAEMDSGIQTIERISNSTKYSGQFLLNGAQDITYSIATQVRGTQNNRLVNSSLSTFNQIFKRDGYQVSLAYIGASNANAITAIGDANMRNQAAKAYLEIDAYDGTISQVNQHGYLTRGQSFILTGSLGSRQFNFSESAHISDIVSAIRNTSGSTGIDASLTFNRTQLINMSNTAANATAVGSVATGAKDAMTIYDNYTVKDDGSLELIANAVEIANGSVVYGKNTDGQGNIFVKITGNNNGVLSYELYKDQSLSAESLIGSGIGNGTDSIIRNNSGLSMKINLVDGQFGDVVRISTGNVALDANSVATPGTSANFFSLANSTASGVQLGVNTSSEGKIYFKITYDDTGANAIVTAYNDMQMREENKVAETKGLVDMNAGIGASIVLDSIWNNERTASTGLGITLALTNLVHGASNASSVETMEVAFSNLGARVYASEYGSDEFIKVQQLQGGIFVNYEDKANYDSARLIEAGSTFQLNGQDATVNVNGQQMRTNGLELNLATPDVQATITFNSGRTGTTTVAQVGYGEGSIFSKNTALTLAFALDSAGEAALDTRSNRDNNEHFTGLLNNTCHYTKETLGSFNGGMQLQLGEGAGDQERTVIGIRSMSTANLGRIEVFGQFDKSRAVWETRSLSIQDVMGGQVASLASDPTLAMRIIEQAIADVSEVRAQIGAVQANMLQTNENNLRVAIENITKTESAIRDTDMASEMTEFTKNQILSNAGVSMLSQANAQAQSVLGLLQ